MSSALGIQFTVTKRHFNNGKLKVRFELYIIYIFVYVTKTKNVSFKFQLKCTARIHKVYLQSVERSIEEIVPPRIIAEQAIKDNHNNKFYQPHPYDQFTVQDAEVNLIDKKDTYLPIQGSCGGLCVLIVTLSFLLFINFSFKNIKFWFININLYNLYMTFFSFLSFQENVLEPMFLAPQFIIF